jgi:hypothetical protein
MTNLKFFKTVFIPFRKFVARINEPHRSGWDGVKERLKGWF